MTEHVAVHVSAVRTPSQSSACLLSPGLWTNWGSGSQCSGMLGLGQRALRRQFWQRIYVERCFADVGKGTLSTVAAVFVLCDLKACLGVAYGMVSARR